MKFSVFQLSRRGGRARNEDRMGYCYTRDSALLVLADGMGGHPEGEVAAQLALQTIAALHQRDARPAVKDTQAFLAHAVIAAHGQIVRYAQRKSMFDTPRTTVVAAVLQDGAVTWAHCGDSRLYLVRGGELLVRTLDHSPTERPARALDESANRNILLSCLGSSLPPEVELSEPMPLQPGDRLLLCSDGIWAMLDDALITRTLASPKPVSVVAPALADMALRKGGSRSDNATLIALEWEQQADAVDNGACVAADAAAEGGFAGTVHDDLPTADARADAGAHGAVRGLAVALADVADGPATGRT